MLPGLKRTAAALAALLMLGACADDPRQNEPVDEFPLPDVPEGSSGSLVAAIDGRMVTCRGWGTADRESGDPAGCDTVYDVMSMTKQFTAAAILKLEMQGRLRVTDPIGRYVADVPPDKRDITVQHLLTHTAGLVDSLGGDYEPLSGADLVAEALGSDLRSRPGARHHYSNVGYSLLAVIIEEASGTGYEEYLAEHLFAPAGMDRTGYVLPDWRRSDIAVEYDEEGRHQGRPIDHVWAADGPYWNLRGNGGLLSTARDMFQWHRALEGEQVLDAEAKADLFRPRVLEEPGGDTRYAFGWVVMDTSYGPVTWHNGGNGWSYGEIARLPEAGAFVFWVTNQYRSKADRWNLERSGGSITEGVIERLLDADR
jgi:CubicO group peptidase (beta-lactamase class C family)